MKKIKLYINLTILSIFITSCGTFGDVAKTLRNEKTRTTDEFLIKKREPLTEPPKMKELPSPGSLEKTQAKEKQNGIKKLLKVDENDNKKGSKTSSIENLIINEIRK